MNHSPVSRMSRGHDFKLFLANSCRAGMEDWRVRHHQEVQLNKAENAWRPSVKTSSRGLAEEKDLEQLKTQKLLKQVRSILNKLTPEKFDQLMKRVKGLTVDTEERLRGFINLLHEKAISEPNFSVVYAKLCQQLIGIKVQSTNRPGESVTFRRFLLQQCQMEFEKDNNDENLVKKQRELEAVKEVEEKQQMAEELEEAKYKARKRSVGNIKFVGELFKIKIIKGTIVHNCISKLLKNSDEESLECLCKLVSTIGKILDVSGNKTLMDTYFKSMSRIVKEKKTSARIRFMLQDVTDLRKNKWVPRREDQGPRTIDQLHNDLKLEQHREQMKMQEVLLSQQESIVSPRNNGRRPGGHNLMGRYMSSLDGFSSSYHWPVDWARLKNLRNVLDMTDLPLTPGGGRNLLVLWSKGCGYKSEKLTTVTLQAYHAPSKPLTKDEVEKKSKAIIQEYLNINDMEEALLCVQELNSSNLLSVFVKTGLESTLDQHLVARELIGLLLHQLITDGILMIQQYFKGLNEILEMSEDLEIDIPRIWLYLAEQITPMLTEGGIPIKPLFEEISRSLSHLGKTEDLVVEILRLLCTTLGPKEAGAMWREAELEWKDFLPEVTDVDLFVREKNLQFTLTDQLEETTKVLSSEEQPETMIQDEDDQKIVDELESVDDPVNLPLDSGEEEETASASSCESCGDKQEQSSQASTLMKDEVENKSRAIIEEYLSINDMKEALLCVQELHSSNLLSVFVQTGLESTLDQNTVARELFGRLLHQLIQEGIIPTEQYFKGLNEILEMSEDLEIDIPRIWLYLAEQITPIIAHGGIPLKSLLEEISKSLSHLGKTEDLVVEILRLLCTTLGLKEAGAMWRETELQWKDFLPEVTDVDLFVTEKNLQFTLTDQIEETTKELSSAEQLDTMIQDTDDQTIAAVVIEKVELELGEELKGTKDELSSEEDQKASDKSETILDPTNLLLTPGEEENSLVPSITGCDNTPEELTPQASQASTRDEVEYKSRAIIEEYLSINDMKEALLCVQELHSSNLLSVFVQTGLESTLDQHTVARELFGRLLHQLIQEGIIPTEQYFKGLNEILEMSEDLEIDIPRIWLYLAEQITPIIAHGGIPLKSLLEEISKSLSHLGKTEDLVVEILRLLCTTLGPKEAGAMWRETELDWKDFLPEVTDVDLFVREKDVKAGDEFQETQSDSSSEEETKRLDTEIQEELNKLMSEQSENLELQLELEKTQIDVGFEDLTERVDAEIQDEAASIPDVTETVALEPGEDLEENKHQLSVNELTERPDNEVQEESDDRRTSDYMENVVFELDEHEQSFEDLTEELDTVSRDKTADQETSDTTEKSGDELQDTQNEMSSTDPTEQLDSEIMEDSGHQKISDKTESLELDFESQETQSADLDSETPEEAVSQIISDMIEDVVFSEEFQAKCQWSSEELTQQLDAVIQEQPDNQMISYWIEENIHEQQVSSSVFVRALTTCVCRSAVIYEKVYKVDLKLIYHRAKLLQKYLEDEEKQLQALYALQALMVAMEHPNYLLQMFFDLLHDCDVITREAFWRWESSSDPEEQLGRDAALQSVASFFTWLRDVVENIEYFFV